MKIILASQSARRRELLEQIGIHFTVEPSIGEEIVTASDPVEVCQELSAQKAGEIADRYMQEGVREALCIIGADTIVEIEGEILGKPKDEADAERMMRLLSGATHRVYTGVTVIDLSPGPEEDASNGSGEGKELAGNGAPVSGMITFADRSDVTVAPIPKEDIAAYIKTDEPYDKAGGYAAQGFFARYITNIEGDYNNVKGLPVGRLYRDVLAKRLN